MTSDWSLVGKARSIYDRAPNCHLRDFDFECNTRSGALGGDYSSLLGADQRGDEVVERGAGAHFVIGMRRRPANFSVREQLAGESLAQNEQFDGLAERHFAVIQGYVLFSPRHVELGFNGFQ